MSEEYDIPLDSGADFELWWDSLNATEQKLWADSVENQPKWSLNPGKQTDAFYCKADTLGFGGAAGGSKSSLLLLLAVYAHRRTVLFRHEATQMRGIVDDMVECLGHDNGLSRQAKRWYVPGKQGHLIEWSGLADEAAMMAQRGIAHDFIGFDEVTEMSEERVRFVQTWLRTSIRSQRTRVVMTFNPPSSSEGRWVIDYFAPWLDERHPNPAKPGELRWYVSDERGQDKEVEGPQPIEVTIAGNRMMVHPKSRTFIPSLVWDNPHLMQNTDYVGKLQSLEEPLRSQMLLGDFRSGIEDDEWQIIPSSWVDEAMSRWRKNGGRAPMNAVGVDPARGGKDFSVIARRHGYWWDELVRQPGSETKTGADVAGIVLRHIRDGAKILIDNQAVGASPYDILRDTGIPIRGVPAQGKSAGKPCGRSWEFFNLRAEMWWRLRCVLNPENKFFPALPPDNKLRGDLTAVRWELRNGKVLVQSKEDIKKILRRSTDDGDAVCLSLMNMDRDGTNDGDWRRSRPRHKVEEEEFPTHREGGWMGI